MSRHGIRVQLERLFFDRPPSLEAHFEVLLQFQALHALEQSFHFQHNLRVRTPVLLSSKSTSSKSGGDWNVPDPSRTCGQAFGRWVRACFVTVVSMIQRFTRK